MSSSSFPTFHFTPSKMAPDFTMPEGYFDLSVPLPVAWDYHGERNPSHPLFVYENTPDDIRTVTWRQGNNATHRAARIVKDVAENHGCAIEDPAKPPVIGILAVKDPLTFWALLTGIIRSGYTAFVISPRNSPAAVTHLLQTTSCHVLFTSTDSAVQSLVQTALANIPLDKTRPVVVPVPAFDDLYHLGDVDEVERLEKFSTPSMDVPALICHSSGSTNYPKPIRISHRNLCIGSLTQYTGTQEESQLAGVIGSAHALPLFHVIGCIYALGFTTATGLTLSMLKPSDPPIQPTPDSVLDNLIATKCRYMLTVPSFLEAWSKDPEAIEKLKTLPDLKISWGGGPLPKYAGEVLIANGININIAYGTTEIMLVHKHTTVFPGQDWLYFEISPLADVYFEPYGPGNEFHKLIVKSGPKFMPNTINYEVDGVPAYDTNDIVVEHPTRKGWWKIYGRADDQIMHSTGEKTNPGPMEHIISKHPSIQGCLMFGREQFQTGILIEPIPAKAFDPEDHEKLAAFRNEIWPSVEEANSFAPQHSRIFKEMIVVTSANKPLRMTDKRTIIRSPNIVAYEAEIRAAYEALERSARQDVELPRRWDLHGVTRFVRELVMQVMGKDVGDEEDIFQKGADSLQATSIRNSISRALRDSNQDVSGLGQNLIYSHPTISSLASFVHELVAGTTSNGTSSSVTSDMLAMAQKFSQSFPVHKPSRPQPEREVILVTGTTGSLGSYILDTLIATPTVEKVYAFNRGDKHGKRTLYQRQEDALEEQGVDTSILDSPKLVLLEGDTSSSDFGLPKEVLDEIIGSVTSIIHNAWRVDFNLALSSFKPLVRGTRNLVDIALASPFPKPPRIVFVSSVASLLGWSERRAVPEHVLTDPRIAASGGYGESKWVSEQILMKANASTPMENVVVRLGQVCGNTRNGNWNVWEWFPALVQSSKIVHCLPDAKGVAAWVPTDAAAAAVVDMRQSDWPYMHLVHPKPVQWSSIITPISTALGVPLVPQTEWLARLQQVLEESANSVDAVKAAAENPALRLVDFYAGAIQSTEMNGDNTMLEDGVETEAFVKNRLETTQTVRVSRTMAELALLDGADVERWLGYWRSKNAL